VKIKIEAGNLYDPRNNCEGEVADLYLENGRVVDYISRPDVVIKARNMAVMPGGIDIHSHVAAFGMNNLRLQRLFPTPREIGRFYGEMGFTHIHEPLMTITTAPFVHHELLSIPFVDTSASLVLPLRDLGELIREDRVADGAAVVAYLLHSTKAMNIKLFEPELRYRQEIYAHLNVDPQTVVDFCSRVAAACNLRLFLRASGELLACSFHNPQLLYFTHLGAALAGDKEQRRAVALLQAGAAGDMGLSYPGKRMHLVLGSKKVGRELLQVDYGFSLPVCLVDLETYHEPQKDRAFQLALTEGRQRLAFSLDCATPAWPLAFAALFARLLRGETGDGYSLTELVRCTRQLPAEFLGLRGKGHLGAGAAADVAIYEVDETMSADDMAERLRRCRILIKAGTIVIQDYKWTGNSPEKYTCWRDLGQVSSELAWRLLDRTTFRAESLKVSPQLTGALLAVGN